MDNTYPAKPSAQPAGSWAEQRGPATRAILGPKKATTPARPAPPPARPKPKPPDPVIEYIREARLAGMNNDEIKSALVKEGFATEKVDTYLE